MSGSSTSGGGATPPYPSPSLPVIDDAADRHALASPLSSSHSGSAPPARGNAGATNYYASGNSRISLSNAATPLVRSVIHNSEYMYAIDARDHIRELSNTNSLGSEAFEDSQKRSYHPIEFVTGNASAGNLAESLESGRLLRHASESSPTSALGLMSVGHYSTGQNSFVTPADQPAMLMMSPLLPRPITYGLGPLEAPTYEAAAHPRLPPSLLSGPGESFGPPPSSMQANKAIKTPAALSDSLPSIHGSVFSDIPKQQLPRIRSKHSMASTNTTADKSPLDPSMTARGVTPNRSTAPSLNMSRVPAVQSPNSSVDTHRPTTPTPFSEVPREGDGRASAFPTQRLPNPPDRSPPHLFLEPVLNDSRHSVNGVTGMRSSVWSTPITATAPSNPTSPIKPSAYPTPLALLGSSNSSSGGSGSSSHRRRHPGGGTAESPIPSPPATDSAQTPHPTLPQPPQRPASDSPSNTSRSSADIISDKGIHSSTPVEEPSATAPVLPDTKQPSSPPSAPPVRAQEAEAPQPAVHNSVSTSRSSSSGSLPQPAHAPSQAPADLTHFAPLIQQTDYRKTEVKNIACSGAFTMGDVASVAVKLRLLRHELLGRAEPLPQILTSAIRAGRVKVLKGKAHEGKAPQSVAAGGINVPTTLPPREVTVGDFRDTLVVFDNVLLAISFALWGSVAHYNELVRGLLDYCASDVTRRKAEKEASEWSDAESKKETPDAAPSSAVSKARLNIPFSSVLRFLNHVGVDVLVMSPNRKAASSFCAKRQQVHRRQRREANARMAESVPAASDPPLPTQQEGHDQQNELAASEDSAIPSQPLRRVLIALSYDTKQRVWCPLTTARPIRQVAAALHAYRRCCRQSARQRERRERRRREAEAVEMAEKAAVQAKLDAWQKRMHAFCQVETPAATAAAGTMQADTERDAGATQHVMVVVPPNGDTITDDSTSPSPPKSGNKLPFEGVLYPNLIQTDFAFKTMLKEAMHPLFGLARVRLIVGVPLGLVVFLFGLAFIIYVTKTTSVCLYDVSTQQCVVTDDFSSSSSGSGSSASSAGCYAMLPGNAPLRFLYGQPVSPGNCLVVTMCCAFAAMVNTALIAFFAARYLALGGVRPFFHYVLQAVQIVLGAITCAFAAYVLFTFRERHHTMECGALKDSDATLCMARLRSCDNQYVYAAHTRLTGAHVVLALAIVYLVLCVLHWVVAFLPAVPSSAQQDAIPTATPDTYAFRPSLFAPDGPTPREIQQLRDVMQPPLRQDLEQCVQQHDRLLTASATIGEMMQANRMQSLKQMKLNERRRLRRSRPFAGQQASQRGGRGMGGVGGALSRREKKGRQRYLAWSGDDAQGSPSGDSDSESTLSSTAAVAATAARDRAVVLAPRLVQRVNEISVKVRARESETKLRGTPNPFLATAVAHATATAEADTNASARPSLRPSSFRRTASNLRKVVVVADADDASLLFPSVPALGEDGDENTAAPSSSLTAENTLPVFGAAASFPSSAAASLQEPPFSLRSSKTPPPLSMPKLLPVRPGASSLTAKSSFVRLTHAEGRLKTSMHSSHLTQLARPLSGGRTSAVSPSMETEIEHIVSRLRGAQQS